MGFRAAHFFHSANQRKSLTPNYSDKSWKANRNKKKFEGLMFFAKNVSQCNEKITDIDLWDPAMNRILQLVRLKKNGKLKSVKS